MTKKITEHPKVSLNQTNNYLCEFSLIGRDIAYYM